MTKEDTYTENTSISLSSKLKDYKTLVKFRLNLLVVISALTGYLFAPSFNMNSTSLWMMMLGGFLVTGASNGLNQYVERDIDKLMDRTKNRPMPSGRMSPTEGLISSIIMGIVGLFLLYQFVNYKTALLSFTALAIYVFVYTPMKSKSSWAVFVGAIPGAIPPMLGWVAATDSFGFVPGMLFFIQFMWQFPHFWAIAWVAKDDYEKAGYKLLPSKGGRNKFTSWQILIYTLILIPISLLPWLTLTPEINIDTPIGVGNICFVIVATCGLIFYIYAHKLHHSNSMKDARRLMFASFIYLPVVQFAYVFDKIDLINL